MELIVDRDAALQAVGRVQGACKRNSTIPVLNNLLLTAGAEGLKIRASDTELQAETACAAEVAQAGAATVPAGRFGDMLKNLPDGGQLMLKMDGPRMVARCGRSRFALPSLPAGDFAAFKPDVGRGHEGVIAAADLARLIKRAAYAISTDQSRYVFNGLYLHTVVHDGATWLRGAASDGHRLAYAEVTCPEGWIGAAGVNVPRKAVAELAKLLEGRTGEVTFGADESAFRVRVDETELISSVIGLSYPDYARVIPAAPPNTATIDVTDLLAGLRRCDVMMTEQSRPVRLCFDTGRLGLKMRSTEGGEAEDELEIDYAGPAVELGFSSRLLADMARQMTGETLRLEFSGPADAVKGVDHRDDQALHILMPLRI